MRPRRSLSALAWVFGLGLILLPLAGLLAAGRVAVDRDLATYFLPIRAYTAERLLDGEVPLWNPLNGLGEPWLANPQVGVFYPPHLLFLLLPLALAFNLVIAFHLLLGAAGMLRLLRSQGLAFEAAWLGAAVWALGGASLSTLSAANVHAAAAYFPWLWAEASHNRGSSVSRERRIALLLLLQFLAGEPIVLFWGVLTTAFLDLLMNRASRAALGAPRPLHRWPLRWLRIGGLAAGLGSVQLLPLLEWIAHSRRWSQWSSAEALAKSLRWQDLLGLISDTWRPGQGYLVSLLLGPLVLALAAISLRARWPAGLGPGIAAIGLAGFICSLGPNLPGGRLLAEIPPLSWNRYPARHFLLAHAALAVAAAFGLQACRRRWGGRFPWLSPTLALGAALPLALNAPFTITLRPVQEVLGTHPFEDLEADLKKPMGRVFAEPHSLSQLAEVFPEGRYEVSTPLRQQRLLLGYSNLLHQIPIIESPSPAGLSVSQPWLELARSGPRGLDALELLGSHLLVGRFSATRLGLEKIRQFGRVVVYRDPRAQPRFSLHRSAVATNAAPEDWARARGQGDDRVWLQGGADSNLPGAGQTSDRAGGSYARLMIRKAAAQRVELSISAPVPLWLLATDVVYPGWSCAVDGRPARLEVTVGGLRAVPLAPGHHRVRFEYRSWSYRIGLLLSSATLLLILFLWQRRWRAPIQLENQAGRVPDHDPLRS